MAAIFPLLIHLTEEQKKESAFKDIKRQLPIKLGLSVPIKSDDAVCGFQNLLRESLTALGSENIEIAQNKFGAAVLFLREHEGELGTFSGYAESFGIANENFREFSGWLSSEKKRNAAKVLATETNVNLMKEEELRRPFWKKSIKRK